jgi:hypothetical protein
VGVANFSRRLPFLTMSVVDFADNHQGDWQVTVTVETAQVTFPSNAHFYINPQTGPSLTIDQGENHGFHDKYASPHADFTVLNPNTLQVDDSGRDGELLVVFNSGSSSSEDSDE